MEFLEIDCSDCYKKMESVKFNLNCVYFKLYMFDVCDGCGCNKLSFNQYRNFSSTRCGIIVGPDQRTSENTNIRRLHQVLMLLPISGKRYDYPEEATGSHN